MVTGGAGGDALDLLSFFAPTNSGSTCSMRSAPTWPSVPAAFSDSAENVEAVAPPIGQGVAYQPYGS